MKNNKIKNLLKFIFIIIDTTLLKNIVKINGNLQFYMVKKMCNLIKNKAYI